jgi:hypothetical protein
VLATGLREESAVKRILIATAVAWLGGCAAHTSMRGSVVMKVSDTDAHVCLGDREVNVGEPVRLYRNVCTDKAQAKEAGLPAHCRKEAIAKGEVTQLLNEHYSVVRFPAGTAFSEGDTVEAAAR